MSTVGSGSVKPRQSHKTDVHVFFISMTFISIFRLSFGDFILLKVPSCFCHANNGENKCIVFMGTLPDLVNSFLIASSVVVSSHLENPIAKVLEHDAAFSMVLNFRLETFTYIAGSSIILFS